MIQFTVPLIPQAKGRPRTAVIAGRARVFTPAATATAEREFIALAAPYAPEQPLDGPVAVSFEFVLPIPPSKPAWWREAAAARLIMPDKRPDCDNLQKLSLDALTRSGQWWRDDSQVVRIEAEKSYGVRPETRVTIEALPNVTRAEFSQIPAGLPEQPLF